jgi:hypothetical protein
MPSKEDIDRFFLEFTQSVRMSQEVTGKQYEEQLFDEVADFMLDAGEIEEVAYDHFQSVDSKIRIDGWGGSISNDGQLRLFTVVTTQDAAMQTLSKKEMESEFSRLINFVSACRQRSFVDGFDRVREVRSLAEEILTRWAEISKIRLCIVSDKKISQRIDGVAAISIDGIEVVHSVWDIQRLFEMVSSGGGREQLSVKLKEEFGVDLPALQASSEFAEYDAYLLVIPGNTLAQIYDRFDTRLLESNVRVFLQARGSVNKGIKDTIENFPEKFLAYNNGITATASAVEQNHVGGQLRIGTIHDLQIVNGGQTTASIHSAFRRKVDLSKIFVQMKLSVIGELKDDDLVADISKYANSQNKVSEADFFSNHPFHKRLETFSRELFAPARTGSFVRSKWFYERARGQYLDMLSRARSRVKAESEYPKKQVVTKTDHAKFEMTFLGRPHLVSKGAQHNFRGFASEVAKKWEGSDAQFDRQYFEDAIARALLFRVGERLVADAPWYDGGYRAQAVTYTWAKIAHDVSHAGKEINYRAIWEDQAVPDIVAKQFLSAGRMVYEYLFIPVPGVSNIGELTKKEDCWNRLRLMEFRYNTSFLEWCVDKQRSSRRDRASAQAVSDSVRFSTLPPAQWSEFLAYCNSESIVLMDKERSIVNLLIGQKILSDAQSRVITKMLKRIASDVPSRFHF